MKSTMERKMEQENTMKKMMGKMAISTVIVNSRSIIESVKAECDCNLNPFYLQFDFRNNLNAFA